MGQASSAERIYNALVIMTVRITELSLRSARSVQDGWCGLRTSELICPTDTNLRSKRFGSSCAIMNREG